MPRTRKVTQDGEEVDDGKQYTWWGPNSLYDPYWIPHLPEVCQYIIGQMEICPTTGRIHWQISFTLKVKNRLKGLKKIFGNLWSFRASRSDAAEFYCHKEKTAVPGTQFELGVKKLKRNSKEDWDDVFERAKNGDHENIPKDILIRNYNSIKRIRVDFESPEMRGPQEVNVYWGVTGAGKTKRVFEECGDTYYMKSSTTKWFDGYRGQENIIIDEFCGTMDIVHLLKWLDRYPLCVEVKGYQIALKSKRWWITSNIDPMKWYEGKATDEQIAALKRRFTNVVHYTKPWGGIIDLKDKPSGIIDDLRLLSRVIKPVDEFGFTQVPNFTQRLEGLKDDKCSNCFRELCFNFRCLQEGHDSFYGKLLL